MMKSDIKLIGLRAYDFFFCKHVVLSSTKIVINLLHQDVKRKLVTFLVNRLVTVTIIEIDILKNKVDLTVTRYLKIVLILPPILTVSISYLVFTFARVALLSASREWQKKHKYVHFFTQFVTKFSR